MDRHHRISAERIAIDSQAVAGSRKCSRCGRAKPISEFHWHSRNKQYHSHCKSCRRIAEGLRRESPEYQARRHDYNRLEETRLRKLVDAHRPERRRRRLEAMIAYRRTERGRLINRRGDAMYRLRKATTDERREQLQSLIDRHTAALAALDAEDE